MTRLLRKLHTAVSGKSGYVSDRLEGGALVGAAWLSRTDRSRPAVVELCVDGEVRAAAIANEPVDTGRGDAPQDSGFVIPIDKGQMGISNESHISVRMANTGIMLNRPGQAWKLGTVNSEFRGAVDAVVGRTVKGWVHRRKTPDTPVQVEIIADGTLIAELNCRRIRPDIISKVTSQPLACGFRYELPLSLFSEDSFCLDVRVAGTLISLRNAPVTVSSSNVAVARSSPVAAAETLPPEGPIRGAVDASRGLSLTGWVFDRENPGNACDVSIYFDGTLLTTTLANLRRPDQRDAAAGWILCGFRVRVPDEAFDGAYHRIDVLHTESGRSLRNSPIILGGNAAALALVETIERTARRVLA